MLTISEEDIYLHLQKNNSYLFFVCIDDNVITRA